MVDNRIITEDNRLVDIGIAIPSGGLFVIRGGSPDIEDGTCMRDSFPNIAVVNLKLPPRLSCRVLGESIDALKYCLFLFKFTGRIPPNAKQ